MATPFETGFDYYGRDSPSTERKIKRVLNNFSLENGIYQNFELSDGTRISISIELPEEKKYRPFLPLPVIENKSREPITPVRTRVPETPQAPRRPQITSLVNSDLGPENNHLLDLINSLASRIPRQNPNPTTPNVLRNVVGAMSDLTGLFSAMNNAGFPVINLADSFSFSATRNTEVPLRQEVLSSFPTVPITDVQEDVVCAICQSRDSTEGTDFIKTSCSHYFHRNCCNAWFARNCSCPLCRTNLNQQNPSP